MDKGFKKLAKAKRFNMKIKAFSQLNILRPITWLLSYPEIIARKYKINRVNMKEIKPPFLLLCTHHAFIDFKITTAALFPHKANYVVAIDGFIKREWLLRLVGGVCKRKFINDLQLIRQIKHVLINNKDVLALYPEARYTLVGTTAPLPDSLGKIAKLLNVPVVMLNMHGHYLNQPVWNLKKRKSRIEADYSLILTPQQLKNFSTKEVNQIIKEAFYYDEYKWQLDNKVVIDYPKRAEGLEKVLYQCPNCLTEYQMASSFDKIFCKSCHKEWQMDYYGQLKATDDSLVTEYPHIPDWYEFQKQNVIKEIQNGTYHFESDVYVEALPNAKGYIPLGMGKLKHSMDGFVLEVGSISLKKEPLEMYACHIESKGPLKGMFSFFNRGSSLFWVNVPSKRWTCKAFFKGVIIASTFKFLSAPPQTK
jgi:1-acyl-sn-glycerol-3-phosphate acyltransferase